MEKNLFRKVTVVLLVTILAINVLTFLVVFHRTNHLLFLTEFLAEVETNDETSYRNYDHIEGRMPE